jgi:hypothetical protein
MVCLCFIKYTKENMSWKCSTINSTFLYDVYNMISKMTCGYEEKKNYFIFHQLSLVFSRNSFSFMLFTISSRANQCHHLHLLLNNNGE